mmetsp:Transcript_37389/g.79329  ORF Transcript_37389/g.79329 Transcript_37389/m.79329 type:complete len:153 (-) Transcript_37389:104-562(-)
MRAYRGRLLNDNSPVSLLEKPLEFRKLEILTGATRGKSSSSIDLALAIACPAASLFVQPSPLFIFIFPVGRSPIDSPSEINTSSVYFRWNNSPSSPTPRFLDSSCVSPQHAPEPQLYIALENAYCVVVLRSFTAFLCVIVFFLALSPRHALC